MSQLGQRGIPKRTLWRGSGIAALLAAALATGYFHLPSVKRDNGLSPISAEAGDQILRLQAEADELYRKGTEAGDNRALAEAIDHRKQVVSLISRDQLPLVWATAQNDLGNALFQLGQRESATT